MWALPEALNARPLQMALHALSRIDSQTWLALLLALALALAGAVLVGSVLLRVLNVMSRRTHTTLDDRLLRVVSGPLRLALVALLFSLMRRAIDLSKASETIFGRIESSLFVAAAFWGVLRVLDMVSDDYRRRFQQRGQSQAGAMLGLIQRLAKITAIGLAGITVLDNAGVHVTALLAGVGLGGIAVALAAQKSIENLFGGLTLYLDRPVRVGSFCRFGDRLGQVEEIGLRSTRVRTLDRTLVTVPNAEFANLQLENFGQRDKMWFHPTLAIRSNTPPDRVRQIRDALRELVAKHAHVEQETARVYVTGFGPYSINLEINAYLNTASIVEYATIAEDLHLGALDVLAEHGSGIAFTAPPEFK